MNQTNNKMKKSVLITALLLLGFLGFGQNKMPYYIMYQLNGDTVYRSLKSVSSININSDRQQLIHNSGTDLIPLSGLDTVCIFRDKFRKYVGEMADWDEVLFSMEQIHCYKENTNGQPLALFSFYVNDSIPNGYFVYSEFDDEGNLEFTNLNDSCVMMVTDVYGDYFNAVVINGDMSSFSIDSVPLQGGHNLRAWQDMTPLQRANVTMKSYLGGLNMAMGGAMMLLGCAMLVPGANVAIGATIALAGAASFISGAFMATRATDLMISDGTHTEGFDEAANVYGAASTIASAVAAGSYVSAAANIAFDVFTNGVEATGDLLVERESEAVQAAKERAQQIMSMELSATGRATLLDMDSHTVRLFGNVTGKLDPNDWFGILVCKDKESLTIDYCQPLDPSHPTGSFYCDFSGLEPCQGYYYRSYYYSHELGNLGFNPEVVSTQKSFKMPGVITLEHEHGNSSNSYYLHGKFQDVADQPTHTVGFCYSYTNEEPTYDDETIQQTVYDNGEFTGHLFLNCEYDTCYYRAFAFINGEISYGEVRQLAQCGCSLTPGNWVDLGLPSGLLWATRNVGASSPTDYGSYFAWGETQPKSEYSWDTYAYGYENYDDDGNQQITLTKYNPTNSNQGPVDNLTILLPGDDAARANWGDGARMPTNEEWLELYNNTTSCWVTINGVNGRRFTGPNGNRIFLPAAGYSGNGAASGDFGPLDGHYWSSSLSMDYPSSAYDFDFNMDRCEADYYGNRFLGHSVRPVRSTR